METKRLSKKKGLLTIIATYLFVTPATILAASGLTTVVPFAGTATGSLMGAIRSIVNAFLTFVAVLAVIFVIIGGFRYIVSQGDDNAQVQARNTILYAVVGIIVIALSAVIINFILNNV